MVILLFQNIRKVIAAEKLLISNAFEVVVRPVPTSISSECGMCIQISDVEREKITHFLNSYNLEFKTVELQ